MVNSPLIRPYLLGGSFGGGTLGSHDVAVFTWQTKIWYSLLLLAPVSSKLSYPS